MATRPAMVTMDFPFWVWAKHRAAKVIDVTAGRDSPRVLDIGAGPGHFAVICKQLKADYLGVDVELVPLAGSTRRHIYDDLLEIFDYTRQEYRISAQSSLGELGQFDLITCLMGTFCSIMDEKGAMRPWTVAEWSEFMDRLMAEALTPGGRVYFQLSRQYITDETFKYLAAIALTADRDRGVYTFRRP